MHIAIDERLLLMANLELVPYLALDLNADPQKIMDEVTRLLSKFQSHRGVKGWRSLALRSFDGNPHYTESEASYGFPRQPRKEFCATPHADCCPYTSGWLAAHFDLDACRRIRFMSLASDSTIPCHRDSLKPVSLVTHLPLNYRAECSFYVDLLSDGSPWRYTRKIPFANGGPTLVNVGTYHSVVNQAPIDRMALLIEGVPRVGVQCLLHQARLQNQIADRDVVERALLRRLELASAEHHVIKRE